MKIDVLSLGVGSSSGTPALGCGCPTCLSTDPRNQRKRASALITINDNVHFLIDTGPDLRQQLLSAKVTQVDAVLYTHPHADHLHGIDDLRGLCFLQKAIIPVFGNDFMMNHIEQRFAYTLLPANNMWDKPVLTTNRVEQAFLFQGITVTPIPVLHGKWPVLGYRIGTMAYITDVSFISEESFTLLQGLDLLYLSCLRHQAHHTHFNVEQAIAAAQRIAAKRTVFIHMTHELEYHTFTQALPESIEVGYDGLRIALFSSD